MDLHKFLTSILAPSLYAKLLSVVLDALVSSIAWISPFAGLGVVLIFYAEDVLSALKGGLAAAAVLILQLLPWPWVIGIWAIGSIAEALVDSASRGR